MKRIFVILVAVSVGCFAQQPQYHYTTHQQFGGAVASAPAGPATTTTSFVRRQFDGGDRTFRLKQQPSATILQQEEIIFPGSGGVDSRIVAPAVAAPIPVVRAINNPAAADPIAAENVPIQREEPLVEAPRPHVKKVKVIKEKVRVPAAAAAPVPAARVAIPEPRHVPVRAENRLTAEEDRLQREEEAKSAHYSFSSSVQDTINDHAIVRQETRDGLALKGMYSYSDGFFRRTVHYEADQDGYRVVKEEIEPIGEGPVFNPQGKADVESSLAGRYSITADDINYERQNALRKSPIHERISV